MEHVSLCFNPRQALIPQRKPDVTTSLMQEVVTAELDNVLRTFERLIASHTHAIYEVRRLRVRATTTSTGTVARSTRRVAEGSRRDMARLLPTLDGTTTIDGHGIRRQIVLDGTGDNELEHFYVAAPTCVHDKQLPHFENS